MMNDLTGNIIKTTFMLWRGCVILEKTLKIFDLITSWTYVFMDNFCPCFRFSSKVVKNKQICSNLINLINEHELIYLTSHLFYS